MINGAHALIYSENADGLRSFFRDVLEFPHVDSGGGWLVFALPPAELAVHPTEQGGRQEIYLMADDLEATIAELRGKGVEFEGDITDEGYGLQALIKLPDGTTLPIYEPRHPTVVSP
jgi:hypothetical protein